MKFHLTLPSVLVFLGLIPYLIYDFYESKQVKDEREDFIQLKTYAFVQKMNMFALLLLSVAYFFVPYIQGHFIIALLILSSLYSEMLAKVYLRKKY